MRLLFDENLSPRLPKRLAAAFPDSRHVDDIGLHGRADAELWKYAGQHGFILVSKDNGATAGAGWLHVPARDGERT